MKLKEPESDCNQVKRRLCEFLKKREEELSSTHENLQFIAVNQEGYYYSDEGLQGVWYRSKDLQDADIKSFLTLDWITNENQSDPFDGGDGTVFQKQCIQQPEHDVCGGQQRNEDVRGYRCRGAEDSGSNSASDPGIGSLCDEIPEQQPPAGKENPDSCDDRQRIFRRCAECLQCGHERTHSKTGGYEGTDKNSVESSDGRRSGRNFKLKKSGRVFIMDGKNKTERRCRYA